MITKRQQDILLQIIKDYTKTGQPVGSKLLVKQLPIKVSSATLRNEMATLEHLNLLQKTHLSSGRIPSIYGYQYYVQNLMQPLKLNQKQIEHIKDLLSFKSNQLGHILKHSANVLANLTNYTSMALRPETTHQTTLNKLNVVPLNQHRVMTIWTANNGSVADQIMRTNIHNTFNKLNSLANQINQQLSGDPISEVLHDLDSDPFDLDFTDDFMNDFDNALDQMEVDPFYVGGKFNLLRYVAKSNLQQVKHLYSLINNLDSSTSFINTPSLEHPISVKIGSDFNNDALNNYSLVSGTYSVGHYGKGVVAVLGPIRMPYSKIIGIINVFRKLLGRKILNYYHKYYSMK